MKVQVHCTYLNLVSIYLGSLTTLSSHFAFVFLLTSSDLVLERGE